MGIVGDESRLLPTVVVAGVIAANDALDFPPLQLIEIFASWKSDFAHEELIEFVGGI